MSAGLLFCRRELFAFKLSLAVIMESNEISQELHQRILPDAGVIIHDVGCQRALKTSSESALQNQQSTQGV